MTRSNCADCDTVKWPSAPKDLLGPEIALGSYETGIRALVPGHALVVERWLKQGRVSLLIELDLDEARRACHEVVSWERGTSELLANPAQRAHVQAQLAWAAAILQRLGESTNSAIISGHLASVDLPPVPLLYHTDTVSALRALLGLRYDQVAADGSALTLTNVVDLTLAALNDASGTIVPPDA